VNYIVAHECLRLNLPQQAVDNLAKLGPEAFRGWNSVNGSWRFIVLTQAHHMLSNYERELAVADEAILALPDILTVRSAKVGALVALGRLDEVNRVIDEILAVQSRAGTPGSVMVQAASELRAHGHREEALRMAARAVDWLRSRPPSERAREEYRPALAEALYAGEKWDEARAIYEALAETHLVAGGANGQSETQGAQQDLPESLRVSRAIDYLGSLGTLAARRGDRVEALRISDELGRIEAPFLFGRSTYWRAGIAALLGEKQQAVDLLRESFAQGNSYDVGLHRDMDLEPLWDYAPFVELLRPKG
jgi:tetratricopeptide (TPR) repeat protein